jgi:hypothetical protein
MENCVACLDAITVAHVRAPCGHPYHIPCITHLFQTELSFPPRCCNLPIPLVSVQPHLSVDLLNRFLEREKESRTLNKVYCSRQKCSQFLGARSKNTMLVCTVPDCQVRTCGWCKAEVAPVSVRRHKCPDSLDLDQHILYLSQNNGWARCPGCGEMIELNGGCFHVICRCRTEFCYLCAAPWKTCSCHWDGPGGHGLIRAAEARVRHLHGAARIRNIGMVREAMVYLRSVHNCGRVEWKSSWGRLRACKRCYRRQLRDIYVSPALPLGVLDVHLSESAMYGMPDPHV